jgi:hypothetical protein
MLKKSGAAITLDCRSGDRLEAGAVLLSGQGDAAGLHLASVSQPSTRAMLAQLLPRCENGADNVGPRGSRRKSALRGENVESQAKGGPPLFSARH